MKKIKAASKKSRLIGFVIFAGAFAVIGGLIILSSKAATGVCSTTGVIGSATASVTVPETTQYRLWVRMQVPDTTNTSNLNGTRIEITGASNQCFTVTTTASNAVNAWQWINSDASAASTPHVTSQISAGTYTVKILGLRAGVKVDKVLFLKASENCTPSNTVSDSVMPGDNCTTPAATASITADSTSLSYNTGTTIRWNSSNATGCTATGGSGSWAGSRATSGNFSTGNLTSSQTYSILCTGIGGQSSTQSVTVNVAAAPAPTATLTANPTSVVTGSLSTLSWSSTNATSCTAGGDWSGSRTTSGTQSTGNLTANRTYTLVCTGPGGTSNTATANVTVTATPPPNDTTAPSVSMDMPGVTVSQGQTSVLVRNQRSVTWRPLASDASGIRTLALTVNGQTVNLTNGGYTFGTQGNGNFELRAVATDNANNVTTSTITIKIRHPDINRDNTVNSSDLTPIILRWAKVLGGGTLTAAEISNYDLNDSNSINSSDMTPVLIEWARYLRGEVQ